MATPMRRLVGRFAARSLPQLAHAKKSPIGAFHYNGLVKPRAFSSLAATVAEQGHLPDILSNDSFYEDSYVLRRNSSTMQSSMLEFLSARGQENIWSGLSAQEGKQLSMLTIGCGDGELDFALLDSFRATDAFDSVDILALEPNDDLRELFVKTLPDQKWHGRGDVSVAMRDTIFDPSTEYKSQHGKKHDVLLIAHVLYYFQDKVEALKGVLRQVKPGGTVVVIHQGRQGVPQIQEVVMPVLRGNTNDMFSAEDIEQILKNDLDGEVESFINHEISAFMNTKEVLKGSEDGLKIMSFSIEADLRVASKEQIAFVQNEFESKSKSGNVAGHEGDGPFMYEPVNCFVIKRKA